MKSQGLILGCAALLALTVPAIAQYNSGGSTSGGAAAETPAPLPVEAPPPPPPFQPPPPPPPPPPMPLALWPTGFYVGLGAGWAGQNNIAVDQFSPPPATGRLSTNDGLIIAGTLGYKLPEIPIRFEFESGYDWHKMSSFQTGGASYQAAGHASLASELFNATYDFPVSPGWNIYAGGGVGVGHVWFAPYVASTGDQIAQVDKWGFMWQGIVGTSFAVAPDAEVFVDYRYRDAEASQTTYTPAFGPVGSHNITENVVMAGVRFYMFPQPVYGPPPSPY